MSAPSQPVTPRANWRGPAASASSLGKGARPHTPSSRGEARNVADRATSAILAYVMFTVAFSDRLVIAVATGGRGALGVTMFTAPAAALLAIWHFGAKATLGFFRHPIFIVAVAPYLVLSAALPVLGVMVNSYPERTLIAVTITATTATSFVILGAALSHTSFRVWGLWLFAAIAIQFVYAVGQVVYLERGPGWELFGPLHQWDLSYGRLYGEFVQARGSGLYFNPNVLGAWAGAAAILAWAVLSGRQRGVALLLALLTLTMSQSRGATVALLAAGAVGLVLTFVRGRASIPGAARAGLSVVLAVAVAFGVVAALEPSRAVVDRFGALLEVFTQGPQADPNLASRLELWAAAIDLNARYPLGTWGPPEMVLGDAVDSAWFRVFAQGSAIYLVAFVLLFLAPFALRPSRFRDATILMSVFMAVGGLTQLPLDYAVGYLFWVLLGAALQAAVEGREEEGTEPPAGRLSPAGMVWPGAQPASGNGSPRSELAGPSARRQAVGRPR